MPALLLGALLLPFAVKSASATETTVSCKAPAVQVATGADSTSARVTVQCTGGSSAGNITFFAWQIKANATAALMIERAVAGFVLEDGTGATITIISDLSNTSGNAWGCGSANCRIISYVDGY